ncbi:MAG: lysylphosphatidylglycerol synthase transmembrane domain-containing protein [Bacteroidota bacterium]
MLLPIGLSLGALGLVLWWTWEPGAFDAVRDTFRPSVFALAILALAIYIVTGGLRLRHISHGALSARDGVRGQLTWDFMSAVTPSAVGGGPFAAYFIARENGLALGQVTSILLFSMLMDQIWYATAIVAMYVAAVWIPVFPTSLGAVGVGTVALYLGGLLVYITLFAYATLVRPQLIGRIVTWIVRWKPLRRFESRVRHEASRLRQQAQILRSQPLSFYLKGAAFTLLYWMARYGVLLLVALSFTRDLRPVLFVFRTAGLWLSGLIMPTPGGSGGIEGLFVLFLAPLLPDGYGGPVLIAWRFLAYYLVLVIGLFVAGRAVRALLMGDTPPPDPTPLPPPASS